MLKRRHIAVLIAGLFVGAQIGLAGVSESTVSAEQEYSEPAPVQAEYLEPATDMVEPIDQVAVASPVQPSEIRTAPTVVSANVFPRSDGDWSTLPSLMAYFDRLESSRRAAGNQWVAANADAAFPRSDGELVLLPSVIAYFDRLEASRLSAVRNTMSGSSDISLASTGE